MFYLSNCILIKLLVLTVTLYTDHIQTFCLICHAAHWWDTTFLSYLSSHAAHWSDKPPVLFVILHTDQTQTFCLICHTAHWSDTNVLSYLSYCILVRYKYFVLSVTLLIRYKRFVLSVMLHTDQLQTFCVMCHAAHWSDTFCVICHTAHWSDTNVLSYLSYCIVIRYKRFVLFVILRIDQTQTCSRLCYLSCCALTRLRVTPLFC